MGLSKKQEVTPEEFLEEAKGRLSKSAYGLIEKAFKLSFDAHKDQKRLSGQPYIIHPVNVAYIIMVDLFASENMIAAGLLHDVVEDTPYTREDMIRDFGSDIADMVSGVTKVSKIKNQSKEFIAAENIRKMVMASIKDPRVIQIKIADKTHNMRTIGFQPIEKQVRIAKEVFSVYAPLAGRLGIYRIKSELEDLAFQVIHPEEYKNVKKLVSEKKSERDEHIELVKNKLDQWLSESKVHAKIEGRAKHFYSIYKKITEKEKNVKEIFDLRAVRIITYDKKDCYTVLGIVHTNFTPIPGRFKDYIATPKSNLYQSLHTTVISLDGKPLEIQIRTEEMNKIAEYGIAAHWTYKEAKGAKKSPSEDKMIARWQERLKALAENQDPKEFMHDFTGELHEDEVFVFTPRGDLFEFPKGATVLDFAFRVHTDVGLHTRAARINDRIVSIRTESNSGDRIEIISDPTSKPSPLWLRFLKTPSARQKVRQYFRKIQDDLGKEIVITQKSNIIVSEKYSHLIESKKSDKKSPKKKKEVKKRFSIVVGGFKDIEVKIPNCCSPLPGDEIVGFITRGKVSVHKYSCEIAKNNLDKKKMVSVMWDGLDKPIPVRIEVRATDRPKIYLQIVESISKTDTNILEAGASTAGQGTLLARFLIEIEHFSQLEEIMDNIKSIENIIHVERVKAK
ncbi:MAG: bifunctional (p)ppGpp synthetase/guanosine-3',5'-bis(diphosphate) 3'-pyrophosphohydrolase [Leptospiraceae bacterium]|nr:bifunctional (p)ppGpp synthetase/guanosine-3',5'-bis(diphosphate) 3'-pyrophosphohydrolase [Leptospiraceae bacterium]